MVICVWLDFDFGCLEFEEPSCGHCSWKLMSVLGVWWCTDMWLSSQATWWSVSSRLPRWCSRPSSHSLPCRHYFPASCMSYCFAMSFVLVMAFATTWGFVMFMLVIGVLVLFLLRIIWQLCEAFAWTLLNWLSMSSPSIYFMSALPRTWWSLTTSPCIMYSMMWLDFHVVVWSHQGVAYCCLTCHMVEYTVLAFTFGCTVYCTCAV